MMQQDSSSSVISYYSFRLARSAAGVKDIKWMSWVYNYRAWFVGCSLELCEIVFVML